MMLVIKGGEHVTTIREAYSVSSHPLQQFEIKETDSKAAYRGCDLYINAERLAAVSPRWVPTGNTTPSSLHMHTH